jgi:hypothetical protein
MELHARLQSRAQSQAAIPGFASARHRRFFLLFFIEKSGRENSGRPRLQEADAQIAVRREGALQQVMQPLKAGAHP